MPKGSKTYVKPGWVAKQAKLTEYEKVRSKNIMEIDERCRALGVKHIANTVFGLGQTSRRKNGEGKRTLSEDDDNEEYRPPQGDFGLVSSDENTGDDGDDETSGYPANMVTHMIREKRSRHACAVAAALAQATPAHPPVTRSSHAENTPEGAGQATPAQPRVTQSSHVDSMPEVATIARARGLTQIGSSSGHPDQQIAEFGKKTILLEGLVLQLAERAGIDPGSLVGEDGTSSRAQDATSLGAIAGRDKVQKIDLCGNRSREKAACRPPSSPDDTGHDHQSSPIVGEEAARRSNVHGYVAETEPVEGKR
ncbi:hypothetical protein MRB53_022993 [Persea americana]|uniref:Uncharacterized protein n=1 Tax=Persea americana TaxID=3435 RepID=A0ACC2L895_PERAE|nr:hypothetical protein MRB53_022993 [Persea americana]